MEYKAQSFELKDVKGLSQEQIDLHIGLYEGYVKHVNLLHAQMNKLASASEEDEYLYSINELRRRLGFEWNGMRLHELYFEALEQGDKVLRADSSLYKALAKQYGSYSKWLEIFEGVSARGPGWAILYYDDKAEQFFNAWVADHEVGQLAGAPILLAVDHWEHAFMVDYKTSEKASYVKAYLSAINWETIAHRYKHIVR